MAHAAFIPRAPAFGCPVQQWRPSLRLSQKTTTTTTTTTTTITIIVTITITTSNSPCHSRHNHHYNYYRWTASRGCSPPAPSPSRVRARATCGYTLTGAMLTRAFLTRVRVTVWLLANTAQPAHRPDPDPNIPTPDLAPARPTHLPSRCCSLPPRRSRAVLNPWPRFLDGAPTRASRQSDRGWLRPEVALSCFWPGL